MCPPADLFCQHFRSVQAWAWGVGMAGWDCSLAGQFGKPICKRLDNLMRGNAVAGMERTLYPYFPKFHHVHHRDRLFVQVVSCTRPRLHACLEVTQIHLAKGLDSIHIFIYFHNLQCQTKKQSTSSECLKVSTGGRVWCVDMVVKW